MFVTGLPSDLSQKHLIALCADLRGSRKTKRYKNNYNDCVTDFQKVSNKVIKNNSKCVIPYSPNQLHSFEGETLKVLFFCPWSDIAAVSAINSALCLHKEILKAKFNSHGLSISLNYGNNPSDAYADAMYLLNFIGKKYSTPPFDSKMLITKKVFELLPNYYQKFFKNIGEQNIAKKESDPPIKKVLFKFDIEKVEVLIKELAEFFNIGLIGILPEGLWPKISKVSSGNSGFFKYLIDNASSEIKILQTYIPNIDVIKDNLRKAIERQTKIEILLLKKFWVMNDEIKGLFEGIIKPKIYGKFPSPLPYQRGKDFDYKKPLQFSSEIDTCANALENLKEGLCKFYNATPSVCLHIFDNLMFVGNFLQGRYAIATPNFIFLKGSALFSLFENEFSQLLKGTKDEP